MDRALVNTQITLQVQFQVDGVGTDPAPDTATVTVTRADGTVLVNNQNATGGTDGVFTYTLTAAQNNQLDELTARWTSSLGTLTTRTEVTGGFLFTIGQARTELDDPDYDVAKILKARTYAESELERALGYALVPRYARETLSGSNLSGCYRDSGLRLRWPYVRTVRSISIDGSVLTDLSNVTTDGGFLYGAGWTRGWGNIVVGYEHGREVPPPGAERAALDEALAYLGGDSGGGSVDARAESIVTADGTIRLRAAGAANLLSATASNWVSANRLIAVA